MATYSFDRTLHRSFRIGSGEISAITQLFRQHVGEPTFTIRLRNETHVRGADFDTLLSMSNSGEARIESLLIFAAKSYDKEASIRFGGASTIDLAIKGSEQDVTYLDRKINEIIAQAKPAMAWFFDMHWTIRVILWLILTVVGVCLIGSLPPFEEASTFVSSKFGTYATKVIGYLLMQSSVLVMFLRWFCLPQREFLIGQGEARSRTYQARRSWLLGGVILAFLVSLAAGWVAVKLF